MELSLERVLQALHDCGICCGVISEPPRGGISFWIVIDDRTERATFYQRFDETRPVWGAPDAGARWLHERALALYPDCDYARRQRPKLAGDWANDRARG